jgi:agmatine deiminase
MPAEWEAHEATWLAWPHELTDWPGKFAPIPWAFAEIVRHLARVERVFLLVENRESEARVRAILAKAGVALEAIEFFYVPTDRGWMRDSGPIGVVEGVAPTGVTTSNSQERTAGSLASGVPVAGAGIEERSFDSVSRAHTPREEKEPRNSSPFVPQGRQDDDAAGLAELAKSAEAAKELAAGGIEPSKIAGPSSATSPRENRALLNFGFNGWAKYDDYKKDAKAVTYVHRRLRPNPPLILPEHKGRRVVLEGGAIDVNGCGTLLTTEQCLLSEAQSRNSGFTRFDYAQVFKKYLGVTNVVWLKNGIAGDDTNGHVDDLARFVDETTVVTVVEDDPAETNYPELQENLAMLRNAKDQAGEPLRVETLPMPRAVMFDGQRLPASYANFYIANRIVLVPTFNDRADRVALNTLAGLFPTREIVPIYCRDLVLGLGTIHCMTQQFPRI